MCSGEDAGTDAIANVVVNGISSAVAGRGTCNCSGGGTIVQDNGGANAGC